MHKYHTKITIKKQEIIFNNCTFIIGEESNKKNEQSNKDESFMPTWDIAENEEENINDVKEKYLPNKLQTLKMEQIYIKLGKYNKAELVRSCGSFLEFALKENETINKKRLLRMNACKQRLCPFCAWRRSLKVFVDIKSCYDIIIKNDKKHHDDNSRFLLLTLTTQNCNLEGLSTEIDTQLSGFKRLAKNKAFRAAYLGYVRSLEIVVDREQYITRQMYFKRKRYYDNHNIKIGDKNNNYLKCNVHIHVLLHTTYAIYQQHYITQQQITQMWQYACKLPYTPICDIRSFKAKNRLTKGRELAEIAKYTVKPVDYLRFNLKDKTNDVIDIDSKVIWYLDGALSNRRLLSYGGTFKEIHSKLQVNYKRDNLERLAEGAILRYYFNFEIKKYIRIKR